jgi:hypothetical protein
LEEPAHTHTHTHTHTNTHTHTHTHTLGNADWKSLPLSDLAFPSLVSHHKEREGGRERGRDGKRREREREPARTLELLSLRARDEQTEEAEEEE